MYELKRQHCNYKPFFNKCTDDFYVRWNAHFTQYEVLLHTYHPHHEVGEQGNPESGEDECQHKAFLPAWFGAVWNCGKQQEYQWPCQKPFNFVHFSICRKKERNSLISHHYPRLSYASLSRADNPRRMFTIVHVSSFSRVPFNYTWPCHFQPSSGYSSWIFL